MGLYVEQLYEESLSEENYQAFEFLRTRIEEELEKTVKNPKIPQEIILDAVKSMVDDLAKAYFNQKEIIEKLKIFIEDYQEIQEIIRN